MKNVANKSISKSFQNPLSILIFFCKIEKIDLQQLRISTPIFPHWENLRIRAKIYTCVLIGQPGRGRTWEKIKSKLGFSIQMYKRENKSG
jgi:hypothetical protein